MEGNLIQGESDRIMSFITFFLSSKNRLLLNETNFEVKFNSSIILLVHVKAQRNLAKV